MYFFISFCIGIFLVYVITPFPDIVFTFPTPDNVDDTIYNNSNGSCYKYKATQVQCDSNTIKTPIYKNKKLF
tara:strand:+ start:507 stop:722 length:216 start_codon:yes stop_codon:yes gene_type:complete